MFSLKYHTFCSYLGLWREMVYVKEWFIMRSLYTQGIHITILPQVRWSACDNAGLVSSLTLGVVWGHWAPGSCSHWPTEPEAGAGAREEWAGLALGRGQAEAATASGPPRPRPAGRARLGSSSYEPEWLWRWLLGFKGGQRRGERSPRPVTLQATRVPAGLGPHSLTPTTLFVTLQRISCNIFLPPEIKQSGSDLVIFYRMRKITSDNSISFLFLRPLV